MWKAPLHFSSSFFLSFLQSQNLNSQSTRREKSRHCFVFCHHHQFNSATTATAAAAQLSAHQHIYCSGGGAGGRGGLHTQIYIHASHLHIRSNGTRAKKRPKWNRKKNEKENNIYIYFCATLFNRLCYPKLKLSFCIF